MLVVVLNLLLASKEMLLEGSDKKFVFCACGALRVLPHTPEAHERKLSKLSLGTDQ